MSEARKGQGAFEYILMLAGVLLIVILIIFILQGTVGGAGNNLQNNVNTTTNLNAINIVPSYTSCLIVTGATGNIPAAGNNFPCCALDAPGATIASCTTGSTAGNCTGVPGILACTQNTSCPSGQFNKQQGRCA
jgi:hypothetical protein